MIPSGIEPATFRSVAQHLNHCATAVFIFPLNLKQVKALNCRLQVTSKKFPSQKIFSKSHDETGTKADDYCSDDKRTKDLRNEKPT